MTVSEKVVNNGGNELTRSELKEILEQYFINVPEDYTLETILKTKRREWKVWNKKYLRYMIEI